MGEFEARRGGTGLSNPPDVEPDATGELVTPTSETAASAILDTGRDWGRDYLVLDKKTVHLSTGAAEQDIAAASEDSALAPTRQQLLRMADIAVGESFILMRTFARDNLDDAIRNARGIYDDSSNPKEVLFVVDGQIYHLDHRRIANTYSNAGAN